MREVTAHHMQPAGEPLRVYATDEPGHGLANHAYVVAHPGTPGAPVKGIVYIAFQNGTIPEVGVNGITTEALIAVCIDRLKGFQSGPFACMQNHKAMMSLQDAMHWLNDRTRRRLERGVEGTHQL